MRRQPSKCIRPGLPAHSQNQSFNKTKLALALLLALPVIGAALPLDAASAGGISQTQTLTSESFPTVKVIGTDGEGLVIDEDFTIVGKYIDIHTPNPGDIVIENGATFWIKDFTAVDDTGFGIGVDAVTNKATIRGDGTLRIDADDPVNPHAGQRGSALWVESEGYATAPKLFIEGINVELVGDKGARADDGGLISIDNKENGGHVYIGYDYDPEKGYVEGTTDMTAGLRVTGGGSTIDISTTELKIYSGGIKKDQASSTSSSSSSQATLMNTASFSSYYPFSTSTTTQNYYSGSPASKISVDADTYDLRGFGGSQKEAYGIAVITYAPYFDSEISLKGTTFNLATDWDTALYVQGDPVPYYYKYTGYRYYISSDRASQTSSGSLTLNFSGDITITTPNVAVYSSFDNATIDISGKNITIASEDKDKDTTREAIIAEVNSSLTMTAEDTMSIIRPKSENLIVASMFGEATLTAPNLIIDTGEGGVAAVSYTYAEINLEGENVSIDAAGGIGAVAYQAGTVNIDSNNLTIAAENGLVAQTFQSGWVNINYDAENDTYAEGRKTTLTGDLLAESSGVINVGLATEDSLLVGAANDGTNDADAIANGEYGYITIAAANGARWNVFTYTEDVTDEEGNATGETVTKNSNIFMLNASPSKNNGVSAYIDLTGEAKGQDLYINTLKGSDAEFILRTQVDTNRTGEMRDHVIIQEGEGAHKILVKAVGLGSEYKENWTEKTQADYLIQHYEQNGATSVAIHPAEGDDDYVAPDTGTAGGSDASGSTGESDSSGSLEATPYAASESDTSAQTDASGTAEATSSNPLSFVLANDNQRVDIGNRSYKLRTREVKDENGAVVGTEWYLQYSGDVPKEPDPESEPTPDPVTPDPDPVTPDPEPTPEPEPTPDPEPTPEPEPEPDPGTFVEEPDVVPETPVLDQNFENLSTSAQLVTTLAGYGSMYSAWTANLTDLRKRLGEVRYGAQDGLWARAIWQKDETDGLTGGKFEQKLRGLQIGVDHIVRQTENSMWLLGGNFKYADADQKVKGMTYGKGDMSTYGAFLYATYANYKGYYTDLVLSLDHYKEKLTAQQSDWTMTHGRYNTWGWGASVETGRMFSSTQNDEGWGPWYANWWIEPQLQLAYYWGKGKNFTMDNGMTVSQQNGQSLIGRAGLVIGKKFNYGKNRKEVDKRYSQFYVKGGVKNEFLGNQKITVNGERFSGNLKGARVYYGAGFDWNFSDQVRMYAQFEREQGSKYKRDYEVSVGIRWQF